MNREKQIEEVRKDIFAAFGGYAKWEEDWQSLAEAVYNAGYRKQSENMVEVVRCKDCEYYGLNSHIVKNKHCLYFSGYDDIFTEPNDYCSFAKMKGGAE